jgi:hypothetical protein
MGLKGCLQKIRYNAGRLVLSQVQCDSQEEFMKRWQKTVVKWNCISGHKTNVRVTDWPHKEKIFHEIHKIEATALPERKGKIELQIDKNGSIGPTTERKTILDRLTQGLNSRLENIFRLDRGRFIAVKDEGEYSDIFTVKFQLDNGDHFCDVAIEIVREVFKIFDIKDERGIWLAWFEVTQETFFQLDDAWIAFARWLRMQHRLPIYGPEDMG